MYVNTLITLQENLATYAVSGKKVTGHVTINSPGIIKCYVQNLKAQENGCKYTFYAFSKAKDKGVRLGELSTHKESKWMVDEKNIKGSGLKLEELDAVAIVAESNMRGADTIAMGFKNNRYIIIPLIDDIIKEIPSKKVITDKTQPISTKANKNVVQPDAIVEGKNPLSKPISKQGSCSCKENSQLGQKPSDNSVKQGNQMNQSLSGSMGSQANQTSWGNMGSQTNQTPPGNMGSQPNQTSWGNVGGQTNQTPPGNMGSQTNQTSWGDMGSQANQTPSGNMGSQPNQTSWGNVGGQTNQTPPGNMGSQTNQTSWGNMGNQPNQTSWGNMGGQTNQTPQGNMENQMNQPPSGNIVSHSSNNDNTYGPGEGIEEGNFEKESIITNKFVNKPPSEGVEYGEPELIKIAKALQNVQEKPEVEQGTKSGEPYASNPETATVVREDDQDKVDTNQIIEKTSEELKRIIAKLKEDQDIKEKIQEIERQVEMISRLPQSHKLSDKSRIEATLEEHYVSKQKRDADEEIQSSTLNDIEIENIEEEQNIEMDTSPRNAITFIQNYMKENAIKGGGAEGTNKKAVLDTEYSVQEEIDYITEIDRKIQEIESRRKQERHKE